METIIVIGRVEGAVSMLRRGGGDFNRGGLVEILEEAAEQLSVLEDQVRSLSGHEPRSEATSSSTSLQGRKDPNAT